MLLAVVTCVLLQSLQLCSKHAVCGCRSRIVERVCSDVAAELYFSPLFLFFPAISLLLAQPMCWSKGIAVEVVGLCCWPMPRCACQIQARSTTHWWLPHTTQGLQLTLLNVVCKHLEDQKKKRDKSISLFSCRACRSTRYNPRV